MLICFVLVQIINHIHHSISSDIKITLQMTKPYSLAVLILCFSLHACNARYLDVSNKNNAINSQDLIKKGENTSIFRVSSLADQEKPTSSSELEVDKNGGVQMEEEDRRSVKEDGDQKSIARSANKVPELLATVSWKLPKKKRVEPQTGFNLDYAPPQEHPGVHN